MAAEIVAHRHPHRFRHDREIGENRDRRTGREARIFFDEAVQCRDIGAMMLVMVDRHGCGVDVRLERVVPITERRNLEHGFGRAGMRDEARPEPPAKVAASPKVNLKPSRRVSMNFSWEDIGKRASLSASPASRC